METLINMITKYKFNWDNAHFVTSNYKLVLDIQRNARKNMNFYQKNIKEMLLVKPSMLLQDHKVDSILKVFQKKFQYYRLSLYIFSFASLLEIMLGGNFRNEYVSSIQTDIRNHSQKYREDFSQCSLYLEKISQSTLQTNVIRGMGIAGKSLGRLIGNSQVVKRHAWDEFFQESGERLKNTALDKERKVVEQFATVSNPETSVFIEKMDDLIQIHNYTTEIYFDKEKLYLVNTGVE